MNDLNIPEHWTKSELGNLVDLIRNGFSCQQTKDGIGYPVSRIETLWNWGIDFNRVGYTHIPADKVEKYKLLKGDILFSHIQGYEYIGKSGLYEDDRDLYHGMNSLLIRLTSEGVLPKFFFHYLKSEQIRNHWKSICKRAINQVSLNTPNVSSLCIPIPPRCEQERIVQKIESCFQKIDETEKKLIEVEILLTKYRESLLAKAFRGELIAQDPEDVPALKLLEKIRAERTKNFNGKKVQEFARISDDEKPFELPAGWEWVRFGELISEARYGTSEKCSDIRNKGDVPVLRMGNIQDSAIDFSRLKYLSRAKLDDSLILEPGDIIFNRTNSIELVGKSAVFPKLNKRDEWSFAGYLIRARLCTFLNPHFFNTYINSSYGRNYIQKVATNTGQAQANVNAEKLKLMPVPLAPSKTQDLFVNLIKSQDDSRLKQIEIAHSMLSLLAKSKEAILSRAFEGELLRRIYNEGTGQELLAKILEKKKQVAGDSEKKVSQKIIKVTKEKKAKK